MGGAWISLSVEMYSVLGRAWLQYSWKYKQGEFEVIIEETDQVNNSVAPIASSFVDKQATDLSISDEK